MSPPTVEIGSKSGKFKYILVQQGANYLVRGDSSLEYHGRPRDSFHRSGIVLLCIDQIFDKLKQELGEKLAGDLKVLGGGKIQVDFEKKQMNVFGESQVIDLSEKIHSSSHPSIYFLGVWPCGPCQSQVITAGEIS